MTRARRFILFAIAFVGAGATIGFAFELVHIRAIDNPLVANYVTLPVACVIASLAIGCTLVVLRPSSRAAVWLVLAGAAAGASFWRYGSRPWASVIGFWLSLATVLLPLHAAASHGSSVPWFARRLLVVGDALVALIATTVVPIAPPGAVKLWFVAPTPQRHLDNYALVVSARHVASAMFVVWAAVTLAVGIAVVVGRVARWRADPVQARRRDAPVVVAAVAWVAGVLFGLATSGLSVDRPAGELISDFSAVILPSVTLAAIAVTVGWVELVQPRLTRPSRGTVELHEMIGPDDRGLGELLANALSTRAVDVVFADGAGWIDASGRQATLEDDRRTATIVTRGRAPMAALLHDPDLPDSAVQLAARLTAAQLDAQRASALARARADAVRLATGAFVRAGDTAAATIGERLTEGPVAALTELATRVREESAVAPGASRTLQSITASVREISHGLYPRALAEEGLQVASTAAYDVRRRFPPAIETTAYLLLRDDDAATINDRGDALVIERPTGLPDELIERVTILGGAIEGTVVTIPVPEASRWRGPRQFS